MNVSVSVFIFSEIAVSASSMFMGYLIQKRPEDYFSYKF